MTVSAYIHIYVVRVHETYWRCALMMVLMLTTKTIVQQWCRCSSLAKFTDPQPHLFTQVIYCFTCSYRCRQHKWVSRLFGHCGGAGSEGGAEVVVVKKQECESELIRHRQSFAEQSFNRLGTIIDEAMYEARNSSYKSTYRAWLLSYLYSLVVILEVVEAQGLQGLIWRWCNWWLLFYFQIVGVCNSFE